MAYLDLLLRFGLNLGSLIILLFVLYYPRYSDKETTIAAALINIFAFAVLSVLSSVQFSVAAGFGLFAVLALFTLRSEPINKSSIAYFFGSIALAVITSIQGTSFLYVLLMLILVLVATTVIDHPKVIPAASQMKVTLDSIPANVASDSGALHREFSERLGIQVLSIRILSIDYVTEVVRAEVNYKINQ